MAHNMASGSSSSSMLFLGAEGTADNMKLMTNTQQESNIALPTSAQDPDADFAVVVSPTTLLEPNRYICEVCFKGFPRKQNLSLHRRVHNLPFTLKANDPESKRVYLCPEPTCVYHKRSNAKRDFGGLKKHYLRKHCTDKKYICDICSKAYGVESDLKAHQKVCAKKNYVCQCGSRFSRDNFAAHQEYCNARARVGAVRTVSHPQTLGTRDNTIGMNSNEGSSTLIRPQISCIQTQSSSHPFTTSYQSQLNQFGPHTGYYADRLMDKNPFQNVNFEGGYTLNPSSSLSLTPSRPNLRLQGLWNPFTGSSPLGSYEQVGYKGYGVGSGPLDNGLGLRMFNIQHQQQQLQNANLQDMHAQQQGGNIYGDGGFMLDASNSHNLTPASHNLALNGMLNPMAGSSDMGSNEQGSYKGYGVGTGYLDYSGGIEMSNVQHQQQQPLHNLNLANMNVHGDWGNTYRTGEGSNSFLDGCCMPDSSRSPIMIPAGLNQALNGMLNPVTGGSDLGSYAQRGYMGYDVGTGPIDYNGMKMFNFEQQRQQEDH